MLDQRAHRRIEAVALLQLDRQAFGEIARAHAGRIERLQDRQHGGDFGQRRAELFGDADEIAGQVAGLVHHVDQILADHAARGIGDRQHHLLGQMIGERRPRPTRRLRDYSRRRRRRCPPPTIPRKPAALPAAWISRRPRRERRFPVRCRARLRANCGSRRAPTRRSIPAASPARLVACLACVVGLGGRRRLLVAADALEQRILLEFGFDIGGKIETGELQQLDGLQQLRRHHQRLALAELESLRQRHQRVSRRELVRFLLVIIAGWLRAGKPRFRAAA